MSDIGYVVIHTDNGLLGQAGLTPVVIYSHYHGGDLARMVAVALGRPEAQARLGDGPYLARMIFCSLLRQDAAWPADFDEIVSPTMRLARLERVLDGERDWGIGGDYRQGDTTVHVNADDGDVCVGSGWEWQPLEAFLASQHVASR